MLRSCLLGRGQLEYHKHGLRQIRAMATKWLAFTSHYDTLEVHPECTKTEIRESWLKLSMLYHPDLNKDNKEATNKFMEIKEAYKVLVNDEARKAYNDKIGFYHTDPPPDYRREWTYKGEMERAQAEMYSVKWSEDKVRKLMGSVNLRNVNWQKTPPSERYRILMEEEKKQKVVADELDANDTPSLRVAMERYLLIATLVGLLYTILYIADKNDWQSEQDLDSPIYSDYETEGGGVIKRQSRWKRLMYERGVPERSRDKFWLEPGQLESGYHIDQPQHSVQ